MTSKIRIAILDDYQNIALSMADWSAVEKNAEITVFHDHISDQDKLVERLLPFNVLSVMRERTPLNKEIFDRLPNLKLVISTGLRNAAIDVDAAKAAGIEVRNTGYHWTGAPEITWALLMAIARKIPQENRSLRSGDWQKTVGTDLFGKTIGIIGLGNIGIKIANYANAFGMNVIAWSPNLTAEKALESGATLATKEILFSEADFITLHVVLSPRSRNMVSSADIDLMKPTAYLINTSRGPLINEADLISALEQRKIAGAALDVFETEPLPADHPFRKLDNVLATPHIGYGTEDTYKIFFTDTIAEILDWAEW